VCTNGITSQANLFLNMSQRILSLRDSDFITIILLQVTVIILKIIYRMVKFFLTNNILLRLSKLKNIEYEIMKY